MKLAPLLLLTAAGALGLVTVAACDGISDPTKSAPSPSRQSEPLATISGALTGSSLPAGARVALVWKLLDAAYAVEGEAEIRDGRFEMKLGSPPATAILPEDRELTGVSRFYEGADASAGSGTRSLRPLDKVQGTVTSPLEIAVAGFVVYLDTNANQRLDIAGPNARTSDEILGGSEVLTLTYFRAGGALDYERLRDRSGILPHAGFNIAWPGENRWLPLDAVELVLSPSIRLPPNVCTYASPLYNAQADDPTAGLCRWARIVAVDAGPVLIDSGIDWPPPDASLDSGISDIDGGPPPFDPYDASP